jgi:hypothetical protein
MSKRFCGIFWLEIDSPICQCANRKEKRTELEFSQIEKEQLELFD